MLYQAAWYSSCRSALRACRRLCREVAAVCGRRDVIGDYSGEKAAIAASPEADDKYVEIYVCCDSAHGGFMKGK